ncbi:YbaB/EbfC family nucleoid-associated protein [Nocardia sp. NBC_00403]|uniref:YbaB/EbfC family nucleoid-associated protein n=1 Tax=Nocardia sp. NBC_00403 TaxID=2975990 RepID=UPI003FA5F90F
MAQKAAVARASLELVRGRGTSANGSVTATVDSAGRLRDLNFTAVAYKSGTQLPKLVLEATRNAERDALKQTREIMRPITSDSRVQASLAAAREVVGNAAAPAPAQHRMTEEEIQAADDAYFERMNERGWNP